jgi:hypothetical protein
VEQELLIFPQHMSSSPVFSGVHVSRSLVFCVMFCISLSCFTFGHCTDSDCPFDVVGLSLMDIAFRGSLLTPQNSENKNIANMNSFTASTIE